MEWTRLRLSATGAASLWCARCSSQRRARSRWTARTLARRTRYRPLLRISCAARTIVRWAKRRPIWIACFSTLASTSRTRLRSCSKRLPNSSLPIPPPSADTRYSYLHVSWLLFSRFIYSHSQQIEFCLFLSYDTNTIISLFSCFILVFQKRHPSSIYEGKVYASGRTRQSCFQS